jgi:hypothetical protein
MSNSKREILARQLFHKTKYQLVRLTNLDKSKANRRKTVQKVKLISCTSSTAVNLLYLCIKMHPTTDTHSNAMGPYSPNFSRQ